MRSSPDNLTRIVKYFCILMFSASVNTAVCQIDELPPDAPAFRLVTINEITGNVEMTWGLSPSADVAGYVIYTYSNGEGYAIDTIMDPHASFYSVPRPGTSYFTESYVVAAIDTAGNISPLSNPLWTIYAQALVDTCNRKIIASWNPYNSFPDPVTGYDVMVSVDGNAYYLAGQVTGDITTFTLDNFTNGAMYCFIVRAKLADSRYSSSNKSCHVAETEAPPLWINADFATVTPSGEIALEFTVDPSSETELFVLEKDAGGTGEFRNVTGIRSVTGLITFIDKTADINKVNYYRLSAINNCGVSTVYSNIASNMVLNIQKSGNFIDLIWNGYRNWLGQVGGYRLFMDTGTGFTEEAVTSPPDTVFSVNIPDILSRVRGGKICFYVTSSEISNPYGITGESSSQTACYEIAEVITIPDVFTPNGDGRNDLFKPVITFFPADYSLVIASRQGRILFESHDFNEAWDGSVSGEPVAEGVYIWILKVTTPSGKTISRTGTVTLFKNR